VGLRNHILDGIKIGRIHLQLWGVTRWRCQSTFDVCLYIWLTHGIDSHQTLWLISCCTGTSTLTYSRESGRNIVWSPQVHQCTRSGWHFYFHQIFTKFMMLPLASVLPLYLNTCHFVCLDALVKHRREAASLWDTWYFSFSKIYKKIMYGSFMKLGKWVGSTRFWGVPPKLGNLCTFWEFCFFQLKRVRIIDHIDIVLELIRMWILQWL